MRRAVVIGKFMPLHKGHVYMLDFAKNFCDHITVLVDNLENETISAQQRKDILERAFPDRKIDIKAISKKMPQEPSDTPEFWTIWKDTIQSHLDYPVDYIIGAMDYIKELARILDIEFIMIDKARSFIPISATQIRQDPFKHWDYIADEAKPLFSKKICIIGSESTGKTTLCQNLAAHFNTIWVPEYARTLIEEQNGNYTFEDFNKIIYGQKALVDTLNPKANKIIFNDTDAITTKIWAQKVFNKIPDIIETYIQNQKFDLYILTTPNTQWVKDSTRIYSGAEDRNWFQEAFIKEMEARKLPYKILKGESYKEKEEKAINIVNNLLKNN